LPIGAFVPGGLIKASDDNTLFNDLATALTQSLATTGVSTMTGQLVGSAGLVSSPGYGFNGATKTGFYLAGANQIGIAVNGVQAATVNSDTSTTWAGGATFTGTISATKGTVPIGTLIDYGGTATPSGWLQCFGQQVSTTTYAALFAVLGTTYGSGVGTFGIPDFRGRAAFGNDGMGGVAAGRITVAGGNFDGLVYGGTGGGQNQTLTASQIPSITSQIAFTGFVAQGNTASAIANIQVTDASSGSHWVPQKQENSWTNILNAPASSTNTGGLSHPIMNPAIIINKLIYTGV
jgi:microcystin-dependent protein